MITAAFVDITYRLTLTWGDAWPNSVHVTNTNKGDFA